MCGIRFRMEISIIQSIKRIRGKVDFLSRFLAKKKKLRNCPKHLTFHLLVKKKESQRERMFL